MDVDHVQIKDIFSKIKLTKFEIQRNIKSGLHMVGFEHDENITIVVS